MDRRPGGHNKPSSQFQFMKMSDGGSLRGCVLVGCVGCEVQAAGSQYRVRAQQLGTTARWENKNSLDITPFLPSSPPTPGIVMPAQVGAGVTRGDVTLQSSN